MPFLDFTRRDSWFWWAYRPPCMCVLPTAPRMHHTVKLRYGIDNLGKVGFTAVYLSSGIRINSVCKVANATLQFFLDSLWVCLGFKQPFSVSQGWPYLKQWMLWLSLPSVSVVIAHDLIEFLMMPVGSACQVEYIHSHTKDGAGGFMLPTTCVLIWPHDIWAMCHSNCACGL